MKTIKVVAAIICNNMQKKTKVFATARGYGDLKGGWEFPGGKVEPGETPQQALVREIMEELNTEIKVGDCIDTIEYDYASNILPLPCDQRYNRKHMEHILQVLKQIMKGQTNI